MPAIPFTHRAGDGYQIISISRPDDIARKALALIYCGYHFSISAASTGDTSIHIEDTRQECSVATETARQSELMGAVDRLITRYHASLNA